MVEVYWSFFRFPILCRHFLSKVLDELALFFKLHQFFLVFPPYEIATFGVVGYRQKSKIDISGNEEQDSVTSSYMSVEVAIIRNTN